MAMPAELKQLFVRFVELGALLPKEDCIDDPRAQAEQRMILREMAKVHNEMKRWPEMARAISAIEERYGPFHREH